jgi:hypothetical protein
MGKIRFAIPAVALEIAIGSTGGRIGCARRGVLKRFEAITIRQVLRTIAAPDFDPQAFYDEDRNGDNRLCIKIVPNEGGSPQFDPAFVFVDNHI